MLSTGCPIMALFLLITTGRSRSFGNSMQCYNPCFVAHVNVFKTSFKNFFVFSNPVNWLYTRFFQNGFNFFFSQWFFHVSDFFKLNTFVLKKKLTLTTFPAAGIVQNLYHFNMLIIQNYFIRQTDY